MDSKLLAFRLARPIETAADDLIELSYDPQSQTALWRGSSKAIASVHCCKVHYGGNTGCTAYGNYCTTYGPMITNGRTCD